MLVPGDMVKVKRDDEYQPRGYLGLVLAVAQPKKTDSPLLGPKVRVLWSGPEGLSWTFEFMLDPA